MQSIQKLGVLRNLQTASAKAMNLITMQKRFINQCLHIKGLPTTLTNENIYTFVNEYGSIQELACYAEAPSFDADGKNAAEVKIIKKRNFITHDRPPGQTAVVRFHNVQSAIMCKDELHWRPYPDENYELTKEVIQSNPRDRPLVNILFETGELFERLRPWVRRDLFNSRRWIAKIEGRPVEDGIDRGLALLKPRGGKKDIQRNGNIKLNSNRKKNHKHAETNGVLTW